MAINIANKQNVTPAGGDFEFAKIKDESTPGANDGVPVNDAVYGDFHQFFAKIIEQALITYNDVPENLTNGYQYLEALKKLFVQTVPGKQLKTKVVEIGDWNMDSNETVTISTGIQRHLVRMTDITIRDDNDDNHYLGNGRAATSAIAVHVDNEGPFDIDKTSTDIVLRRVSGGLFDDALFDSTSFNRGWLTIIYE